MLCPPAQAKWLCTSNDPDAVSAAHQPDPSSFIARKSDNTFPESKKRRDINGSSNSSNINGSTDDNSNDVDDSNNGSSLNVQHGTYQVWSMSGGGKSGDIEGRSNCVCGDANGGSENLSSTGSSTPAPPLATATASDLNRIAFMTVELNPGDALFIPSGWWHLVEAVNCEHSVAVNWYFQPPETTSESHKQ